ncbi:I78 family peptidase inhibitor [Streptomyces subrutilus]|uniref:Proteinase inhibitor I78 n=1 Tax=Streptomyces subrutilus TaxID=36818 RepID=A0A1E5Q0Z5_9ACTN|nr:I78 family peptidase inhibitor [Streptomyces subrutilus]OEJ35416.1 proteinase inhibitor I78 [Streptomyces subrutilus]
MTTDSASPATPDDPTRYVGLGADEAERRARGRGWTTVRTVPPGTILTMEYREGRLNFEVEDGTVRRAWTG